MSAYFYRGDISRGIPPSRELHAGTLAIKKETVAAVFPSSVLTEETLSDDDTKDAIIHPCTGNKSALCPEQEAENMLIICQTFAGILFITKLR